MKRARRSIALARSLVRSPEREAKMTEWRVRGDEDEDKQSLADTEAEATQQSRGAEESLADTEAEVTILRKDECGES
jgi:hypothetical protein